MKSLNGLTFYICFGSYGGFEIAFRDPTWLRISLGWVSISLVAMDIENTLELLMKEVKEHGH